MLAYPRYKGFKHIQGYHSFCFKTLNAHDVTQAETKGPARREEASTSRTVPEPLLPGRCVLKRGEMRYKKGGRSEKVICTYYRRTLENKDNTYAGLFTTPRLVECAAEIHQEEKWRLTDLEVAMHEKPCREKKRKGCNNHVNSRDLI